MKDVHERAPVSGRQTRRAHAPKNAEARSPSEPRNFRIHPTSGHGDHQSPSRVSLTHSFFAQSAKAPRGIGVMALDEPGGQICRATTKAPLIRSTALTSRSPDESGAPSYTPSTRMSPEFIRTFQSHRQLAGPRCPPGNRTDSATS